MRGGEERVVIMWFDPSLACLSVRWSQMRTVPSTPHEASSGFDTEHESPVTGPVCAPLSSTS